MISPIPISDRLLVFVCTSYAPKSENGYKINTLTLSMYFSFTKLQIIQNLHQNHTQKSKLGDPTLQSLNGHERIILILLRDIVLRLF